MSNAELVKLSAAQMAEKIRSKEVSSRELTQAHLDVIEAAEPTVNAFLHVSGKEALAQADAFDKKLAAETRKACRSLPAYRLRSRT